MKIYSSTFTSPELSGGTQTPIRDITGRVTGYSSNGTGLASPNGTASTTKTTKPKPLQNASGQFIDTTTGLPYHGTYTDEAGRQQFFSNGAQVNNAADVGIQNQDFSVSKTQKNPVISGAIDNLQSQASTSGNLLSKSVADYLAEAGRVNAQSKDQLTQDQAALNPDVTINRLNNDVSSQADALNANNRTYETGQRAALGTVGDAARSYQTGVTGSLASLEGGSALTADALRKNNADYAANQNQVQGDVAANNTAYSQTVADRLTKLQSDLDAQNQQYETAAQAVADSSYAAAQKNNDLYHLTSGTPRSGSGALDNRAIRNYNDINTPLQAQLADRRYQQVNQLDTAHAGADATNYGNLMSQYAGESALNSDVANRGISLEQYLQGLGTQNYSAEQAALSNVNQSRLGTANAQSALNSDIAGRNADTTKYLATTDANTAAQIQSLRTATAGMSRAAAATYLQQLAVPAQVAQQILSGAIGNESAIQGLDERANAYTFNTPYDTSRVPASPGFSANLPRSYAPTTGSGTAGGNRSYSPTDSGALPNGGSDNGQPGSTAANGWILGSDGNYYVPDQSAPNGFRLVWRKPTTQTGAYPDTRNTYTQDGSTYNVVEPASGSGVRDYGVRS